MSSVLGLGILFLTLQHLIFHETQHSWVLGLAPRRSKDKNVSAHPHVYCERETLQRHQGAESASDTEHTD